MGLNAGQEKAVKAVLEWASVPGKPGLILEGPAGTGKTHIVKTLTTLLRGVCLSAPTNKAVNVLNCLGTGADAATIYSILGLRMEEYQDTLRLVKAGRSRLNRYNFVFCDEASMLGSDIVHYVQNQFACGVKFLFIGDRHQLNPIGEEESRVWTMFDRLELDEQVRHDNQILKFVMKIRRCTDLNRLDFYTDNDKREGVWSLSGHKFEKKLLKYARLGLFAHNTKAVAWRNRTVDRLNRRIREEIFGSKVDQAKWLLEDHVSLTAPHQTSSGIDLNTGDEAVIKQLVIGAHPLTGLKAYTATVDMYGQTRQLQIIHEDEEEEFNQMLAKLANDARSGGGGKAWKTFWGTKNSFASVRSNFAITSHGAQGSTVVNCFVDSGDILANTNDDEARRSLYVACSRPTSKLFIL